MVADTFQRRPVGLSQDRLHLRRLKITRSRDRRPLDRDGEDFGTLRDRRRLLARHEVEEAADRGEPAVTRADRALAFMLGMTEERADLAGGEISQGDLRDPAPFRSATNRRNSRQVSR